MLTSNCMYRPYIDTNNRQGMKLCRFKNRTPARFGYIYCTLFTLCHSNEDMYPFLKDSSFRSCICFVHTIAQFSRILRFSHNYCQIFRRVPYIELTEVTDNWIPNALLQRKDQKSPIHLLLWRNILKSWPREKETTSPQKYQFFSSPVNDNYKLN
jgi:hypothetical protein